MSWVLSSNCQFELIECTSLVDSTAMLKKAKYIYIRWSTYFSLWHTNSPELDLVFELLYVFFISFYCDLVCEWYGICTKSCVCSCRSTMREHVRTHTGDKPLQCPRCCQQFRYRGLLSQHIRIAHLSKCIIYMSENQHECQLRMEWAVEQSVTQLITLKWRMIRIKIFCKCVPQL